jgi:hypothetical protein
MTFFDQLTVWIFVLALVAQLVLIFLAWKYRRLAWFVSGLVLILLAGQMTLLYGSLLEPRWVEVRQERVVLDGGSQNQTLRVVFVADFHLGPYKQAPFAQQVVDQINQQKPDLVLIGGDFIYSYQNQADELHPLTNLESAYGTYAVLGNHDYGLTKNNLEDKTAPGAIAKSAYVAEKLEEFGVQVLRNEIRTLNLENGSLQLVGLEDLWGGRTEYQQVLRQVSPQDQVILLEHNPDIVLDEFSHRADLILAGHTHGGQIRLPGAGPLAGTPTALPTEYAYGLFDWNEHTQLLVTKGVGEMGPRARLFCRPEIVVLEVEV